MGERSEKKKVSPDLEGTKEYEIVEIGIMSARARFPTSRGSRSHLVTPAQILKSCNNPKILSLVSMS